MKGIFCVLLFFSHSLFAFEDVELAKLWSSIADIANPTLEDYKNIETYLKEGDRPYLKPLVDLDRLVRIRNFQLVGIHGAMPIFEKHSINIDEKSKDRCILLFASRNGIYPDKARRALNDLRKCGYSGHVLLRIGGFPNLSGGGLKLCHVPYAFKVAFLKEAQNLGYAQVLWIDTAMHPLTNLEKIFSVIEERGYFFTNVGFLSDNRNTHLSSAAACLDVSTDLYEIIPHLSSSMMGFNMKNPKSVELIDEWLAAAENVYPFITCWPEELSLSIIAWRHNLKPFTWFGNCVCGAHELEIPIVQMRPLQFYIDPIR